MELNLLLLLLLLVSILWPGLSQQQDIAATLHALFVTPVQQCMHKEIKLCQELAVLEVVQAHWSSGIPLLDTCAGWHRHQPYERDQGCGHCPVAYITDDMSSKPFHTYDIHTST